MENTMDNTLDLSELTLQESDVVDYCGEHDSEVQEHEVEDNELEETEVLFEAGANESDETSETDESLGSEHELESEYSLESEEIPDGDDELEVGDKVDPLASASADDEQELDDGDLDEGNEELDAGQEEVEKVDGMEIGGGNSEEVKVGPKRSKWFAEWLRQKEELFGGGPM